MAERIYVNPKTENIVFTNVTEAQKDALLYTAIHNEVQRLKETGSKKERQNIRKFILAIYREMIKGRRQEQ